MSKNSIPNHCWELFDLLLSGTACEGDISKLNELLRGDPKVQTAFLEYCQLHIDLSVDMCANQAYETFLSDLDVNLEKEEVSCRVPLPPLPIPLEATEFNLGRGTLSKPVQTNSIQEPFIGWSQFAVIFSIGVLCTMLWNRFTEEKISSINQLPPSLANPEESLPTERFVAQLVSNTGAVWNATARRPLENGDQLGFEETVTIQEGTATFELAGGLTLKLEGPAVVSIAPDGTPAVQYGKVVASLPWGAKNTAIKTSLGEVQLDGDDIAGIGVFGSGLNVYVFRGEVLVGARTPEEESFLLSSGEGNRFSISPAGIRQQISSSLKKEFFVPWNSISSDLLTVSDTYVASVRESKPIGYWRFEEVVEGQVLNEVSDKYRGTLGGKARLVLQKNNHVIEFGFGAESGYLFMDEPFDELAGGDYSFELWVKPNHFHRSAIATLLKRRSHLQEVEGSAFILETLGGWLDLSHRSHPHSFRYLHRSPPGSKLITGTSCYSSRDYKPRKWQHVVAVKQGHKMLLYVNGRVLATEEDRTDLVPGLHLVVGQLRSFESVRPFVGQLDELAIYDHALTKKEIELHYKQIRK